LIRGVSCWVQLSRNAALKFGREQRKKMFGVTLRHLVSTKRRATGTMRERPRIKSRNKLVEIWGREVVGGLYDEFHDAVEMKR